MSFYWRARIAFFRVPSYIKMEIEKKNRLRAPNFTNRECLHLCEIVEKYKHIIENKKTDGATLQDKNNAWLKVAEEYNSTTTTYSRTQGSLQQCYKNIKKKAKKQLSASKMSIPGKFLLTPHGNTLRILLIDYIIYLMFSFYYS